MYTYVAFTLASDSCLSTARPRRQFRPHIIHHGSCNLHVIMYTCTISHRIKHSLAQPLGIIKAATPPAVFSSARSCLHHTETECHWLEARDAEAAAPRYFIPLRLYVHGGCMYKRRRRPSILTVALSSPAPNAGSHSDLTYPRFPTILYQGLFCARTTGIWTASARPVL